MKTQGNVHRKATGQYSSFVRYNVFAMDKGRKRVLLIAAAILAARKLAQFDRVAKVPATICAVDDAVRWAAEILRVIDERFR